TFYHIDRNPISELAESLGLTGGRGSIQQGEYVETTYISKYDSNGNLITKIREIGDVEDGKGVHTHAWEFNPPGSFRGKLLKPNSFTYPDIVVEH
ncbi:MAG TPA: hypothetical protein VHA12_00895, partial [Candidatus Nanoarchaeia archaeon]|nr:hypothetical protein [Candidatus Nanoarchaeia archaeon]